MPSTVCAWLLVLLAGLCVVYLGQYDNQTVPGAFIDSQEQLVRGLAGDLRALVRTGGQDLVKAAAGYDKDPKRNPAKLLATAAADSVRWSGAAVLDGPTRKQLAARGEPVPLDKLPATVSGPTSVPIVSADGAWVLAALPLTDGRILVGALTLRIRSLQLNPDAQQTVLIASRGAGTTHVQGVALQAGDRVTRLVDRAVDRTSSRHRSASVVGPASQSSATGIEASGALTAPVITAVAVRDLNVVAVSVVHVPVTTGGSPWRGLYIAAGTLVIAGFSLFLVRLGLVRPVRRLLVQAKAVACGELGPRRKLPGTPETRRISVAFDDAAAKLRGRRGRNSRRGHGLPGLLTLLIATWLIATWSVGVAFVLTRDAIELPDQIMVDTQNQTDGVAAAMRRCLEDGLGQLVALASANAGKEPSAVRPGAAELLRDNERYRAIYVVDGSGRVLLRVGDEPLRRPGPPPAESGVRLNNTSGRVPEIFASTRLSASTSLIAEFDIHFLASLLRRDGGRLRVVDERMRTIIDTGGYLAFQKLSSGALVRNARHAFSGQVQAEVSNLRAVRTLVTSAPLEGDKPSLNLRWAIVAERPLSEFRLADSRQRHGAWMVGFVGICVALLLCGWHLFIVLGPLRRLGRAAFRLVGGDTRSVISPHRQDEIGAIAVCLDICRQAQVYGPDRLGGAVRLRGSGRDHTVVLSKIPSKDIPAQRFPDTNGANGRSFGPVEEEWGPHDRGSMRGGAGRRVQSPGR